MSRAFEIGINKNDPQYVLYRVEGCEGGNGCGHRPTRCAIRWDTYDWHLVSTGKVVL